MLGSAGQADRHFSRDAAGGAKRETRNHVFDTSLTHSLAAASRLSRCRQGAMTPEGDAKQQMSEPMIQR